jgi:UDP-glucose 4-epimerase
MEVNVLGTLRVLEVAFKHGVKRFVYASTVYTMGHHGSFYRVSKQAGEGLCKAFCEEYELPYTIVKYGSLYGHEANHWNFIYRVCKELLTKGEYCYQSSPDAMREFIHVTDAAKSTVKIASDPEFENASVLITGHTKMRMGDFFDIVTEIIGGDIKISYELPERRRHYVYTPYSFDPDVPIRVTFPTYIDITEGILDCIKRAKADIDEDRD